MTKILSCFQRAGNFHFSISKLFFRANAAVRTIRPIKKGDELLDNYGYHYAVTNKGDRQKSL